MDRETAAGEPTSRPVGFGKFPGSFRSKYSDVILGDRGPMERGCGGLGRFPVGALCHVSTIGREAGRRVLGRAIWE